MRRHLPFEATSFLGSGPDRPSANSWTSFLCLGTARHRALRSQSSTTKSLRALPRGPSSPFAWHVSANSAPLSRCYLNLRTQTTGCRRHRTVPAVPASGRGGHQIITNSSDRYLLHRVSTSDPLLLLLPRDLLHLTLHIGHPSPLTSGDIIGIRCNTTCATPQELVLALALVLVVYEI